MCSTCGCGQPDDHVKIIVPGEKEIEGTHEDHVHSHDHHTHHRHQDHQHDHSHDHTRNSHSHIHKEENSNLTPWLIFLIFLFGPCEPLIPLLIYPAADHNIFAVILISLVFSIATILTMLVIVFSGLYGLSFLQTEKINKHIHTLAGFSILVYGVSIQFLGL